MSFFEKKYMVTGNHGDIYSLTAKQLYERVLNDSKSDYNWIASASELVSICRRKSFPTEYAIAIKCAIYIYLKNIGKTIDKNHSFMIKYLTVIRLVKVQKD